MKEIEELRERVEMLERVVAGLIGISVAKEGGTLRPRLDDLLRGKKDIRFAFIDHGVCMQVVIEGVETVPPPDWSHVDPKAEKPA